jgi:hypothetical protein
VVLPSVVQLRADQLDGERRAASSFLAASLRSRFFRISSSDAFTRYEIVASHSAQGRWARNFSFQTKRFTNFLHGQGSIATAGCVITMGGSVAPGG